ncbi:MAG: S46 family peptidase [Flavobacteriales bacterium]
MKRKLLQLMIACMLMPATLCANEGMWLVSLLNRMNEAEMKGLGLNLTAEEIYSINNASLKDAVVRLNNGGCTGEIVSVNGLVFTNHHCAFDAIQSLSTVDNNMLRDGFCAKSFADELPIPGFKIQFLVRIENATDEVLAALNDSMTEEQRDQAVADKTKELKTKWGESGKFEVEVKSFFYGNEYYVMVYQAFTDIRLVGNPPESVGKFGGDTDNWMWPRHTGDFSMLRVYADKDNNPAAYNAENVPFKPKHHFPVNLDGIEEGDFSMIMGFPGRTSRYLTSYGVNQNIELRNPVIVECFGTKLESWKQMMNANDSINLMYAAKYASIANTWKNLQGETKSLKRLDVKGQKELIEADFTKWVNQRDDRKMKYGQAIELIREYHNEWDPMAKASLYSALAGSGGAEFIAFAASAGAALEQALGQSDEAKKDEGIEQVKKMATAHFGEYNVATDKLTFVNLTNLHRKNIIASERPSWHANVDKAYKGNVQKYADDVFAKSIFTDQVRLMAFLAKPNLKKLQKDIGYTTAKSAGEHSSAFRAKNPVTKSSKGYRLFVAGLREMNDKKTYAPDANSTMRLTYGKVGGYKPADAATYSYYTTAKGIMEKRDNSNPEFVVPDKLADLINKKDFGKYANKKGELVTCFINDLDITGGNSGSPVIDGDGNLIGIAFDGNWEAMSGNIAFEPELQRTINVDIRYVLFTIEKLMGGKNIVDELTIAKKKPKPVPAPPVELQPTGSTPATPATPAGVGGIKPEVQKKIDDAKAKAAEKNNKNQVSPGLKKMIEGKTGSGNAGEGDKMKAGSGNVGKGGATKPAETSVKKK